MTAQITKCSCRVCLRLNSLVENARMVPLNNQQQMPHASEYKVVFNQMAVIDGRYF